MKKLHLITGLLFMVIFLLSGQYLSNVVGPFEGDLTAQRMMYRASHIYILWAASLNIFLGCYWVPFSGKYVKLTQRFASLCVLSSQPVLLAAFLIEPAVLSADRGFTLLGCGLLLIGTIFVLASAYRNGEIFQN